MNLKNPCVNMDTNLVFQKCKHQYWDKLNEVKTPWVLVGAVSSKHNKSAYHTIWIFIWPLIYCTLALRKCLENYWKYWTNRTQTFFLFVLLEEWFVYHLPHFLQFFWRWRTKLIKRENGTKLKNLTFNLNLLLAPMRPIKFALAFAS